MKNKSKFVVVIALALSLSAVAQQPRRIPAGGTPPTFSDGSYLRNVTHGPPLLAKCQKISFAKVSPLSY